MDNIIKCDKCDKQATIHLTDIVDGNKLEVHLCEDCAVAEGIAIKESVPLSQILEQLVTQTHSPAKSAADPACPVCGLKFSEFRQQGLLGCPNDYDAFGEPLMTLLQRAQDGASEHIGKMPSRASDVQKRQNMMLRLRGSLRIAVAAEDYEQAARIRDQIKQLENN